MSTIQYTRINSKNVTIDTIHSFLSDFVGLYFSKPEVIDLYLQVFEKKIKALIDNGEDDSKNARYIDKFGKLDFETIKNNLHTINEQIQNIAQKKDTLCRRMYN